MKRCPRCTLSLPIELFASSFGRSRPSSYCRSCQSDYCRAHYRKNKAIHNHRRRVNQTRYRARNRRNVVRYLREHPCVDCGEADIRVLEFDHVRDKKSRDISNLVREGWAWQRIVSEIAKCDVRCANCHRRRTVQALRWPNAIGA